MTQLCVYIIFSILLHYGLSQDTEYNSLCQPVGLSCISLLLILFVSANPKLPIHPPTSPLATTSLFSMSVSLFLFCREVNLYSILASTYKDII